MYRPIILYTRGKALYFLLYMCLAVALRFESCTEVLGITFQLEVRYPTSIEKEEDLVLLVKCSALTKIKNEAAKRKSLLRYFEKNYEHEPASCQLINEVAYLTFENSSG